jgi:carbamoyltransferase
MQGSYLGPAFSQDDVRARLTAAGARFSELSDAGIIDATASALADGKAVGWFQGRMEFGPRALGNRSILADPRRPEMQRSLNLKVKFRESFRPFAPSVLREHLEQWFHLASDSPYMLIVADVAEHRRTTPSETERALTGLEKLSAPCSEIPAVTHVDHSARVQTVHADTNPRYHALIHRFHALTGCPVLVNTSFNVRGEPIVATPEDAFRCFMGNDLDVLVIENCLLTKEDQAEHLRHSGEARFPLD